MKTRPSAIATLFMSFVFLVAVIPGGVRSPINQLQSANNASLNKAFVSVQTSEGGSVAILDTMTNEVIHNGVAWPNYPAIGVMSSDGTHVYMTGSGVGQDRSIYGMNTDTYQIDTIIPLTGCNQRGIAITPDGHWLYVADNCNMNITPINLQTNTAEPPIALTGHPEQIAISPDGTRLYVSANADDRSFVIDTATNTIFTTFLAGGNSHGVAVSPDGQFIYIANLRTSDVTVVSALDLSIIETLPALVDLNHVTVSPDGMKLYVTSFTQNIAVIDIPTKTVKVLTTAPSYGEIAISEDGTRAYAALLDSTVAVIDTTTDSIIKTIPMSGPAITVVTKSAISYTSPTVTPTDTPTSTSIPPTPTPPPTPTQKPMTLEPLIFIPGAMGSKLLAIDGTELWPAPFANLGKQNLKLPSDLTIFASDAIRTLVGQDFYQGLLTTLIRDGNYNEYQGSPMMTPLERCRQSGSETTLYVFAYDWRKDIADKNNGTAAQLKKLITCIREKHLGSKVNILTHSMGGLIARRYIIDNRKLDAQGNHSHYVDKLITIASPWLGAPKSLNVLLNGDVFGNALNYWILRMHPEDIRQLVETFPGAHELLPSSAYFQLGGRPFVTFDEDGSQNLVGSYSEFVQVLDNRYQSKPGTSNINFHTSVQDDWRNEGDDTGVQYYHIYGITKQDRTLETVVDRREVDCKVAECSATLAPHFAPGKGDGTVPIRSASRISGISDLNARNDTTTLWIVREDRGNGESDGIAEHTDMTKNPKVQNCILFALRPVGRPLCELGEAVRPSLLLSSLALESEPPSQPAYYLYVRGVNTVTVADSFNNTTDTFSGTLSTLIPDVTMHRMGDLAQLLIMPTNQAYTITLRSGIAPLAIEVSRGTAAGMTEAIRYRDLVLPPDVTAMIRITSQGVENLRYDANGDGAFETPVTPTVSVSGAAANDMDPPTITVSRTGGLDNTTVTLTAVDVESGVKRLLYSLDGLHYQSYTTPIQVNSLHTTIIYIFSDDNVANRTALITYYLSTNVYLPIVQRWR